MDKKQEESILLKNKYRFKNIELKHLEENIYNNSYNIFKNEPKNSKGNFFEI